MIKFTAMKISKYSLIVVTLLWLSTILSAQAQQSKQHASSRIYQFQCSQGKQFRATLIGDRAIVTLESRSLTMRQVPIASGLRYQLGQYALSGKDDQAKLTFNAQPLYQRCSGTMIAATLEKVLGTVTYRERIALPPNAIVQVTLESVGAPMQVIAEQTIETQGRQVPIPFSLNYDASSLREEDSYRVRAQILVDQQLRFTGSVDYPTSPSEKPAKVEIIVRSMSPTPRSIQE